MNNYIDKVIAELREEYKKAYKGILTDDVLSQGITWFEQFISEKLKEQEAMYEKAIGKDDHVCDEVAEVLGEHVAEERIARNKLRDEIRQAVKKAKGEV